MIFEYIRELPSLPAALIIGCIICICVFEFINGFHDTANAVANVIYTHALKPMQAVIWSGMMNFLGVLLGGVGVAMSIVKLLPLNDLLNQSLNVNIAMVLAICISAILWNLGTWYLGIPSSSSHTLIGSILGAGLGFATMYPSEGVNWAKASDIGASLLLSPAFGFTFAIMLIFILKKVLKKKSLFQSPQDGVTPPRGVRALLISTCTMVSFFHGSNDGQKGVGLMMVVLMAFLPTHYALNENFNPEKAVRSLDRIEAVLVKAAPDNILEKEMYKSIQIIEDLRHDIRENLNSTEKTKKFQIRKRIESLSKSIKRYVEDPEIFKGSKEKHILRSEMAVLSGYTDFAPLWVIIMIASCLGLGTMIGWKRIVVTIGEKIGKSHLTFAEGATADLTAAATIGLSTFFHLPVSTTHVLSSGVAGGMVASGGVKNLQKKTMVSIAMAWILTLPVSIAMGFLLFLLFNLIGR
ncbi:MAG TPA: inorganic phosphate transporter [Saprospiraceae bacterium]|jgi:PiT family inorganic phosphate transporter|nr:MAG: phosphate transporter [Candidatus Parvibacillus calidus]MBX7178536.1 inorganic phosphate transporter [Saprospiraceae bacterium]MBK7739938.1 inorganic phosphate transporter [Candidatus Parvibacillus calidus]MCB0592243.1 inorganic phosphate transporter [Saprospiraceae bacterium]MCC7148751.1 inorganic phosphate transporter [Saprospiraceae bacterium]